MKANELIVGKEYLYQINSTDILTVKYVDFDGTWYNFEKENGDITTVNEHNLYRIKEDIDILERFGIIKSWADYHEIGFILKIKTLADLECIYNYAIKHELGIIDHIGLSNNTDTTKEYETHVRRIERMIGYSIY